MRPPILDRYILGRMARPLIVLSAIIMAVLSIENLPRLIGLIEGVQRPMALIGRFMIALAPEYLALGLLVGDFLATAMMLRALALSSELAAIWAVGVSPMRVMRTPMLVGLLIAGAHVGLRGFAEPWSERHLDKIGQEARAGDLGVSIRGGELRRLPSGVVFLADRMDPATGALGDVFVHAPDMDVTARSAHLRNGGHDGMILTLTDGAMTRNRGTIHFDSLSLPLRGGPVAGARTSTADLADRASLPVLARVAAGRATLPGVTAAGAHAALALRWGQAGLALLTPWLAFVLAIPSIRQPSGMGMAIGTGLIVGYVEAGKWLSTMANPVVGQLIPLGAMLALIVGLHLWQRRSGYDVVEVGLGRLWRGLHRRRPPPPSNIAYLRPPPAPARLERAA